MQASGIDLALLRFALQHTDSPNLKDTPIQAQDYEWLREAMASFESDAQKMKKLLELVKKDEGVSEEQKHVALEELQLLVEDLDNATDFVKLEGLPVTLHLIQNHTNEHIRTWALWLLATAVQNHPKVQEAALNLNALEITLPLLKDSLTVKQKALFAIIGLIKDNAQATNKFLALEGIPLLSTLLSFPDPAVRMKAAFLLVRVLAANTDGVALRSMHAPEVLAPLVAMTDDPNDDAREKAVHALEIIAGDAQLREQCVALGLAGVVRDRVRAIAQEVSTGKRTQAESQEAIGVLMQLLKKVEAKKG